MSANLDFTATQINGALGRSVSPDTTPTGSSTNFVTSGGIHTALAGKGEASDVSTLQGQVSTLQGQVSTLQGQVSTLQGQVTTLMEQMALTAGSPVKTELESLDSRVTVLEP